MKKLIQKAIVFTMAFLCWTVGANAQENLKRNSIKVVTESQLLNNLRIADHRVDEGIVSLSLQGLSFAGELYHTEKSNEDKPYQELSDFVNEVPSHGLMKVESFHLSKAATLQLDGDLTILSQGDVILDGDVFGTSVVGNIDGQHLIIKSGGNIIIRGNIQLSNGGDANAVMPLVYTHSPNSYLNHSLLGSISLFASAQKWVTASTLNGGTGGSIFLQSNEIIIEGHIKPGDGGTGLHGGKSGDGGSITLLSANTFHRQNLKGGNGGSCGGHGGNGGAAQAFVTLGTKLLARGNSSDMIGGDGGHGQDGHTFLNGINFDVSGDVTGTAGINGAAGSLSSAGGDGGAGGDGISVDANGTGGAGGAGGNGGHASGFFDNGGIGRDGGAGGEGIGGNGATNGGIGIGGSGGNFGIGGMGGLLGSPGTSGNTGVTGTSTPGNVVILPVELVSFRAVSAAEAIELLWVTASESNNRGFEVEHSINGGSWETIGFVNGHGTTTEEHFYTFFNEKPSLGINYYRLKQMDFDGKSEYSKIEVIQFGNGQNIPVQIFPNPVKDGALTVKLETYDDNEIQIHLYDLTGRTWLQQTSFDATTNLNVNDLAAGIYLIEIAANGQITRQKVVIE